MSRLGMESMLGMSRSTTSLTSSILMFGPCSPGRFFAAAELKTMLCHLLLNYDVKFEDKPAVEIWWTFFPLIDSNAMVSFRARSNLK
jgi:hypothetical protein